MKFKKFIATEFLYIVLITGILSIVFLSLKCYNFYHETKIKTYKNEIYLSKKNIDKYISIPLKPVNNEINQNTLNSLINFYNTYPIENYKIIYEKFPQLRNDSLLLNASMEYFATVKSRKYKTLKEINLKFPEFFIINKNEINTLKFYRLNIRTLNELLIKHKSKILSSITRDSYLTLIGCWLLIILFGLRHLFFAIKWAIMTIKTND